MKKYLHTTIAAITVVLSLAIVTPAPQHAAAAGLNVFGGSCGEPSTSTNDSGDAGGTNKNQPDGGGSQVPGSSANAICGANKQGDFEKLMTNIINTILMVLGMIAVIMIIIGGIRYTTSNGESAQIQAAKNTILYAVVGLVVAILAYAIVNFVLAALG